MSAPLTCAKQYDMSAEAAPLESPSADKLPSSSVQVQDVEPQPVADDNHELRELGYVPELKRVRSFGHIFSMTITCKCRLT